MTRDAAVIEAHDETFCVIPDKQDPCMWSAHGAVLRDSEIAELGRATGGGPVSANTITALASVKRVFPDATVTKARLLSGRVKRPALREDMP